MSTSGIVFDVQRFSIHDGPGIRSTVFLKGCAFRCFWCHNPEGLRQGTEIRFFPNRCAGCGRCITVCPEGAHTLQGDKHVFRREICRACGRCAETCYAGALELCGRRMTAEQVTVEVLRDRVFYENSGGGVTLSGGEPLLQRGFAREILERCKAEEIHTALQTAGCCGWDELAELLSVTDLIMIDIKHVDDEKHQAAVGVSNRQVLSNARRLMQADKAVVFRVPLIPTVNDTPEEIKNIAVFVSELVRLRRRAHPDRRSHTHAPWLELLPFHRLAAEKYRSLGLDYRAGGLEPPSREKIAQLAETAAAEGIAVRVR